MTIFEKTKVMSAADNYLAINRQSWNNKVDYHLKSAFYNHEAFLKGANTLQSIEVDLLGTISNTSILHLQCHFGQDTISLNRLGAQVTGVDFSNRAIEEAKSIAEETESTASFICSDIYDLPNHLEQQFDIVFTSYGTIGWLPDLDKWSAVVAHFLKPGGRLILVDFHPVVWMFDDNFQQIEYSYFNKEPIIITENGTYADKDAALTQDTVSWNHPLTDILSNLIKHRLSISSFKEFDYSPYACFNQMKEIAPNKFVIEAFGNKLPMVYAIEAIKQ
jgi:SAM-dependent methyltransferase